METRKFSDSSKVSDLFQFEALVRLEDYDHILNRFLILLTAPERQSILQDLCERFELGSVLELEAFHRHGLITVPRLFGWWDEPVSQNGELIRVWAVEEVLMSRHHTRAEGSSTKDAVLDFAQYGLFQQLAEVDPVVFILLQCFRSDHKNDKIDPRVPSVSQSCISAQPEAEEEPFFCHHIRKEPSPLYSLISIEANFNPLHYSAVTLGTDHPTDDQFYGRYERVDPSYTYDRHTRNIVILQSELWDDRLAALEI